MKNKEQTARRAGACERGSQKYASRYNVIVTVTYSSSVNTMLCVCYRDQVRFYYVSAAPRVRCFSHATHFLIILRVPSIFSAFDPAPVQIIWTSIERKTLVADIADTATEAACARAS